VDASRGSNLWSRSAQGHTGLAGDENLIFGAESDSKVHAWQRQGGQIAWSQEGLRFRGLTAPLVLGRSVVLGDENGLLHFLSRQDGKPLLRVVTDGSAIVGRPVAVDQTLVVVTRAGGVFGYRPE
jgi:outer membrane protein assembly factor BamB